MGCHILCVDHDTAIRSLREDLLTDAGYRVRSALNYAEAILAIDKTFYEVCVVCGSIPPDEAARLEHAIGLISPETRVVREQSNGAEFNADVAKLLLHSVRSHLRARQVRKVLCRPVS